MSQYKIEAGTGQHIGDREEQQDRVALFAAPKAPGYMLAVIADGMGGLSGGALAAEQVVSTAQQIFERFSPLTDTVEEILHTIAHEADTVIKLSAMSSDKKPHSTVVLLIITPQNAAIWAHAGDSRLYCFDGPNCSKRTTDHSYLEQLKAENKLDEEKARDPLLANLLVNVLGSSSNDFTLSLNRRDGLKAGDSFLLCTDGLWQYFSEAELGAAIAMNTSRKACEMLISKARERATGSKADNCTLAIVKLVKPAKEIKDYTVKKMQRAV
ncbi:PP2C family protein-serine/threonine phosphatase [Herminiimonas sp. NPDC097707]|uniref:PP2C family protein-serine/threonine phosphatase n=1 Tax=Herminiimonas sp. NPDC097707 TaxID=3364007 RepID=UPI00383B6DE9